MLTEANLGSAGAIETIYSISGSATYANSDVYTCPEGKVAYVELLFYFVDAASSGSLQLYDDKAQGNGNPTHTKSYHGQYGGQNSWYTEFGVGTSVWPWNDDYVQHSQSASFSLRKLPVYSGQRVGITCGSGSLQWRWIYKITEMDATYA
jgi:hypothetical protein